MDKNGFKITSTKKVVPLKNLLPYERHYTKKCDKPLKGTHSSTSSNSIYTYCSVPTRIGLFLIMQIRQSDFIISALLIGDSIV